MAAIFPALEYLRNRFTYFEQSIFNPRIPGGLVTPGEPTFADGMLLPILVMEIILTIPLTLIYVGWKTVNGIHVAGIHEMREDIVKDKLRKMKNIFLASP